MTPTTTQTTRTARTVTLVERDQLAAELTIARERAVAQTGFALPAEPWDVSELPLVCVGEVTTDDEAVAALVAGVRGARLVIALAADHAGREQVLDDLLRLGELTAPAAPIAAAELSLSADQRALLEGLANGASIGQVAGELFISLRTAERRVAAARRLLGARTTAEAILRLRGGR